MKENGRVWEITGLMKKYRMKISELCFYVFFCSLLFAKGIGLYDGQVLFKALLGVALIAFGGKLLLTRYRVWELAVHIGLLILGVIIYYTSHEKGAFLVILLLCALKNMNLDKVFKAGAITWTLSFVGLFFMTSAHIIRSPFKVHARLGMGRIIRWSLGYAHPNVLHISYLVLVCFLVYILRKKFRYYYLILFEAGNLFVFMYSLSTTGFLVTTALLILVLYWNIRKKFCVVEQILIQLCLSLCLFLSFGAPILLKGKAFIVVNKILNTRLELSKWFLENLPIRLFGNDTTKAVTAVRTMDNSYVFALITYGLLFVFFMVIAYLGIIYRKTKEQDGMALCLILSCLIAGLTEPFLFNTSFKNVSLLFIGTQLFSEDNESDHKRIGWKFDGEINIILPDIFGMLLKIWKTICKYRVKLLMVSILGSLAVGALLYRTAEDPVRYLLPRKAFEYTDDLEESYYLRSKEDIQEKGDKILGFESPQTEMVAFKGNIATVERFRNTVSGGIWGGVLTFVIGAILVYLKVTFGNGVLKHEE